MDGAGIMNLPTEVGGSNTQDGLDSFAPLIAAQQAARDMGYPRFTRELLAAGSEMDPAEVQEFLQTIRDAGLTPDDVALMRRVVEAVFNDPNNYPEVRQTLLQEGIPEDLLPETFDLEFFTALRMAVEEAENLAREPRPTEQEMPMGMPMEGAPVEMAEGGIVGLPELKPIARAMASMGRQGDTMLAHITPQEAMMLKRMGGSGSINPYTGLPEFFLKGIFKGISKAINGVVKGVKKFAKSTVGRAITAIALGAFLGPAAAGFLGVSSAAGVAAVSGALGGFGSSILAGDGLKGALRNGLTGAVLAGGMAGITGGSAAFAARPELQAAYQQQGFLGTVRQTAQNYFGSPVDTAKQMYGTEAAPAAPDASVGTAQELVAQQPPAPGVGPQPGGFGDFTQGTTTGAVSPQAQGAFTPPSQEVLNFKPDYGISGGTTAPAATSATGLTPGAGTAIPPESTFLGRAGEFARDPSFSKFGDIFVDPNATGLAKYKPAMYAGGIGLLATQGDKLFATPEIPTFGMTPEQRAEIQAKFKQENPQLFGSFVPTYYAAKGSGPQGVEDFPRKNGHISGPGTGTSDDIPAMLSDGEFVFTARAVRNMGGGSRRKGAAKMYRLMKMLEGGPVGKTAKA